MKIEITVELIRGEISATVSKIVPMRLEGMFEGEHRVSEWTESRHLTWITGETRAKLASILLRPFDLKMVCKMTTHLEAEVPEEVTEMLCVIGRMEAVTPEKVEELTGTRDPTPEQVEHLAKIWKLMNEGANPR
jgi:hypothetical protein